MKYSILLTGCLCVVLLAVMPVQAFTSQTLTISLDGAGNAQADMQYELSIPEQAALFFHVADLKSELKSALENNLGEEITINKVDGSSAEVIIPSFATLSYTNTTSTMATPEFSFASAQDSLRNKWYSSFVPADFAPETTTITFPDGYQASFNNLITIPSVSHQITA
ncbi:MAG: hypothetical protein WC342_08215 [Methanoregula sp.]|jgi:hypothetical protein